MPLHPQRSRTAAPRSGFALSGRSTPVDPLHDAVRADLADARLADRVFAPHYVLPVDRMTTRDADLRAGREADAAALLHLAAGTTFELLDVTGDAAWGIAQPSGTVGYVDADVLGASAP